MSSWQTTVCAFVQNYPGRCCHPACDGRAVVGVVDDSGPGGPVEHARCLSHLGGLAVLVSKPIGS